MAKIVFSFLSLNSQECCVSKRTCKLWRRLLNEMIRATLIPQFSSEIRQDVIPLIQRYSIVVIPSHKLLANLTAQDTTCSIALGLDENNHAFMALRMKMMRSTPASYGQEHAWSNSALVTFPQPRASSFSFPNNTMTINLVGQASDITTGKTDSVFKELIQNGSFEMTSDRKSASHTVFLC